MKWLRRAHRAFHAYFLVLLREHRSPGRVALGVLAGCVVGCTPLFGLHLPICLLLALVLRLNKVVVYGAANLSVPPLVPVLGLAAVQIGERLRHGAFLPLHRADFHSTAILALAGRFFLSWLLGGVVLGAGIGAVAGGLAWVALSRRRRADAAVPPPIDAALARAAARYAGRGLPPRFRWYAHFKYRLDPCYRAIAALVPPGAQVVDLGTGLGMLPVLLGELGEGRRALGIEWDAAKAACGQAAATGLPGIEVRAGDLRQTPLPPCDAITLVDVLHYYDAAAQRAVLSVARAALRPGGMLLVREADPGRRGGARWTRAVERAMVRLGWNRGPAVHFRPVAELWADLEGLGLQVRRAEVAGALHPGNVLLCAALPTPAACGAAP